MVYSWILAEDVLDEIFEDEQSLDYSNSEDGKDIYGYLGAFVVPRGELEDKSRRLTRRSLLDIDGNDEVSSQDDELDDDLSGSKCNEPSLMDCDNDFRSWEGASGSARLEDPVSLTQDAEEVALNEALTEMVSDIMEK